MTRIPRDAEEADEQDGLEEERAGRDKDVSLREKGIRAQRTLIEVPEGALVLRSSRGHAWLEANVPATAGRPAETERHVLLPRWAQVVPGDLVRVAPDGRIDGMVPRRSVLRRQAGVKGTQTLAANVDQAVIVLGPKLLLREGFLARALCGVIADHVEPLIVFQKADLDDDGAMAERAELYRALGFQTFVTSAVTGEGVAGLRPRFSGKTTVLVGQSGVGKSTLVNSMFPGVNLKTGEVDDWGRGKHTTTLARALRAGEGLLIDLPGVREFGLSKLDERISAKAFPEFARVAAKCRFPACKHAGEDGCAVEAAVDEDEIDVERWNAWQGIVASFESGEEGGGRK